jgi:hypothetical protein
MEAATVADMLEERGYTLSLQERRLQVRGSEPPPDELDREIVEHRDSLAARALLSNPPAWLAITLRPLVEWDRNSGKAHEPGDGQGRDLYGERV